MNFLHLAFFAITAFININNEVPVFEYEIRYNLGKALVKKGYVFQHDSNIYFTSTKSIFLEEMSRLSEDEQTGVPNITIMMNGVVTENVVVTPKENRLEKLSSVGNQIFVTHEDLAMQKWTPTGVKKVVSGRECIELTTFFRGRNYVAFVDLSVPFRYGPWKFNNFPGLPVVIEDDSGKLKWTLTKISSKPVEEVTEFALEQKKLFSGYPKKTLQEYAELYDRTEGGRLIMASKIPRDYKRDRTRSSSFKRGGLELRYEWEEQPEK